MKSILKNWVLYPLFLLAFTLIALEVILRFYNPFAARVKGFDIILPVNERYEISMEGKSKYEPKIIHTKNSLGFRGPERPQTQHLSFITVGGSTTECYYNSDSLTWSYLLAKDLQKSCPKIWLNNAGLNGHSTFGHTILLEKYLVNLKPDVILFLVGINDVARGELNQFDSQVSSSQNGGVKEWLVKHSELMATAQNLKRVLMAKKMLGLSHDLHDQPLDKLPKRLLTPQQLDSTLAFHQKAFVPHYAARLEKLIQASKAQNITPILMTQPLLFGDTTDAATGLPMGQLATNDNQNGKSYWLTLELYNNITRQLAAKHQVKLIDLARMLPKDSRLYYDAMHYTTAGNQKIAELISPEIGKYLEEKFGGKCR